MAKLYSILIDLAVLGFFGFLYYWLQKRRIIKASTLEIQDRIQEFLYELHSFLEGNKNEPFYKELDSFAREVESGANTHDLGKMRLALGKAPASLPEKLKDELESIAQLF